MSICRAPVCHRLESNAQRGESEIVPAKRKPLIIHSAFEYAISRGQVPGVGEIVTDFRCCIDGSPLCADEPIEIEQSRPAWGKVIFQTGAEQRHEPDITVGCHDPLLT